MNSKISAAKRDKQDAISNLHSTLYECYKEAKNIKNPVATCKTMLSAQEQNLLRLLARNYYKGHGAIFDGGCCLGGCAQSFAQGLAEREDYIKEKILHVYEWGQCDAPYLQAFIKNAHNVSLNIGDSFANLVEQNLAQCAGSKYIDLHIGDILEQQYPETIEILFLDVCKTPQINYAMQQLFGRLIPGRSIVIQQDYVHEWLPWIHVTMGFYREYFEPIGGIGPSFVFLYKKAIPQSLLELDTWRALSLPHKMSCLTRYYGFLTQQELLFLELARARLIAIEKEHDWARSLFDDVEQHGAALPENLGTATYENISHGLDAIKAWGNTPVTDDGRTFSISRCHDLRAQAESCGQGSSASAKYQDDVARHVLLYQDKGDAIVEVGCHRGGLTVQLAYMVQSLGKRLYVVDPVQANLDDAKSLCARYGYEDYVSFHCTDFQAFIEEAPADLTFQLVLIDNTHSNTSIADDCFTLQNIYARVHGAVFYGFSLRHYADIGKWNVDDVVRDIFGGDVPLFYIGALEHVKYGFSNEHYGKGCYFYAAEAAFVYGKNMQEKQKYGAEPFEKYVLKYRKGKLLNNLRHQPDIADKNIENYRSLEQEIFNLKNSRSWKLTAPLRRLRRIFS